jgi:hypothetical protein
LEIEAQRHWAGRFSATPGRKRNNNPPGAKQASHRFNRPDRIAIGGEQQRHVEFVSERIGHHLDGDEDVEGGLNSEVAYSLSDVYSQQVETIPSSRQ